MEFGDMESAGIESAGGGSDMDFDLMNEADWAAFAIVLETALDGLEEGRFLCVEVEVPRKSGERLKGSVPYIQAVREPEGLHVEVASNESLDPRFRLSKESRRLLRDLGLSKPEGEYLPNYWAQFRMHRVEEAARLLVTALRSGYGVENPAFLQTDHKALVAIIGTAGGPVRESLPAEEEPMKPWLPVPGEELAIYPKNFEDLSRLIAESLLPMVGPLPKPDEDGDAGILAGPSSVIFVRPSGRLPEVVVHSPVVRNVTDRKAARREVAMLNDVHPGIQYTLVHSTIQARVVIPATPFAPTHLRVVVDRLLTILPAIDSALAGRVGGQVFLQDAEGRMAGRRGKRRGGPRGQGSTA